MNYRRTEILAWAMVKLTSPNFDNNYWWHPYNRGHVSDEIFKLHFSSTYLRTEYCFPVVAVLNQALKVLAPPEYFHYQHGRIHSLKSAEHQNYFWTLPHFPSDEPSATLISDPNPCAKCGWYCQQTCHTWCRADFL